MANKSPYRAPSALAKRHFNRIVKRPFKEAAKLFPLCAITFVTKGRMLAPAGSVSVQVLSSMPDSANPQREFVELSCLTAEVEHHTGACHFSRPRMSHNFARSLKAGPVGGVLDARDPDDPSVRKGDKPNADWVRWGLDADKARLVAADYNHRVPTVPVMPTIRIGFANPELAPFEMSHRLKQDIAAHMGRSLEVVEQMDTTVVRTLGQAHWDSLWTPPGQDGNDTGLWLIDAAYVSNFSSATRVYEDYSALCGVSTWNPVRDVAKMGISRESLTAGVDVSRFMWLLDTLSNTTAADASGDLSSTADGNCSVEAMEDEVLAMLTQMRENTGFAAAMFDDDDIITFMMKSDLDVLRFKSDDLVATLGEENTAQLMRQVLKQTRPHLLPYVDDAELVAATKNWHDPLHIARLPRVQVIRRDLRIPVEDALRFGPERLGVERLYANLWPGDWSPRAEYVAAYDAPRPKKARRRRKKYGSHAK